MTSFITPPHFPWPTLPGPSTSVTIDTTPTTHTQAFGALVLLAADSNTTVGQPILVAQAVLDTGPWVVHDPLSLDDGSLARVVVCTDHSALIVHHTHRTLRVLPATFRTDPTASVATLRADGARWCARFVGMCEGVDAFVPPSFRTFLPAPAPALCSIIADINTLLSTLTHDRWLHISMLAGAPDWNGGWLDTPSLMVHTNPHSGPISRRSPSPSDFEDTVLAELCDQGVITLANVAAQALHTGGVGSIATALSHLSPFDVESGGAFDAAWQRFDKAKFQRTMPTDRNDAVLILPPEVSRPVRTPTAHRHLHAQARLAVSMPKSLDHLLRASPRLCL